MSERKVYLISHRERKRNYVSSITDYHKIGIAENPEKRLTTLQSGSPHKLELVTTISTKNAEDLERELHMLFKEQKFSGEWFNLNHNQVNSLKAFDRLKPKNVAELFRNDIAFKRDREKGMYVEVMEMRQQN